MSLETRHKIAQSSKSIFWSRSAELITWRYAINSPIHRQTLQWMQNRENSTILRIKVSLLEFAVFLVAQSKCLPMKLSLLERFYDTVSRKAFSTLRLRNLGRLHRLRSNSFLLPLKSSIYSSCVDYLDVSTEMSFLCHAMKIIASISKEKYFKISRNSHPQ